jgi:hypothetical protein
VCSGAGSKADWEMGPSEHHYHSVLTMRSEVWVPTTVKIKLVCRGRPREQLVDMLNLVHVAAHNTGTEYVEKIRPRDNLRENLTELPFDAWVGIGLETLRNLFSRTTKFIIAKFYLGKSL